MDSILREYAGFVRRGASEGNITMLTVKLAKEAVFGEEVMVRCTPGGSRDLPGLPTKELYHLKKIVLSQFPQHWKCLHVGFGRCAVIPLNRRVNAKEESRKHTCR